MLACLGSHIHTVYSSYSSSSVPVQWRQAMNLGSRTSEARLRQRMDVLQPNKCCSVIFTVSHSYRYWKYVFKIINDAIQ